jgi:hypothetical protein
MDESIRSTLGTDGPLPHCHFNSRAVRRPPPPQSNPLIGWASGAWSQWQAGRAIAGSATGSGQPVGIGPAQKSRGSIPWDSAALSGTPALSSEIGKSSICCRAVLSGTTRRGCCLLPILPLSPEGSSPNVFRAVRDAKHPCTKLSVRGCQLTLITLDLLQKQTQ